MAGFIRTGRRGTEGEAAVWINPALVAYVSRDNKDITTVTFVGGLSIAVEMAADQLVSEAYIELNFPALAG